MSMTDPIADMLTRIRNATRAKHQLVKIPSSKLKLAIADVLKREGFIKEYEFVPDNKQGILKIHLKYSPRGESVINEIVRVSKPGRRIYRGVDELGKVLSGLGASIVSTSKGVMSDKECRKHGVGGEVLCHVW